MAEELVFRRADLADLDAIVEHNKAMALETEGLALDPDAARRGAMAALLPDGGGAGGSGSDGSGSGSGSGSDAARGATYFVLSSKPGGGGGGGGGAGQDGAAGGKGRARVLAQLMITHEWSDWRAADVWWVQSVYVSPQWRGRGLFRRLYSQVRAEAVRSGAAGVRLYADDSNSKAHAAYEVGAVARRGGDDDDRWVTESSMGCVCARVQFGEGWPHVFADTASSRPHLLPPSTPLHTRPPPSTPPSTTNGTSDVVLIAAPGDDVALQSFRGHVLGSAAAAASVASVLFSLTDYS